MPKLLKLWKYNMVSTGFFHVPLPNNTYLSKFEKIMESNSDFNNQVAQYTLCFNDQCPKAENCLRHSITQYNTAQNIRLSVINPLCYPEAGKECPHFRTNKKIRIAWGFKHLYDDMPARISRAVHRNLEAIFNHSPYYRYRNQELGLTPKQQECIRQVCRKHGWKEEVVFDRYTDEYDW